MEFSFFARDDPDGSSPCLGSFNLGPLFESTTFPVSLGSSLGAFCLGFSFLGLEELFTDSVFSSLEDGFFASFFYPIVFPFQLLSRGSLPLR